MKYKILTDDAVTEDKSRNQTHKNIAEQLYNVISDSATPGLTIGIEGKWGSGKSTVIKILNEKLKGDKGTFVFYIDTWAHEGDPLRRIFLESFIEKIKETACFQSLKENIKSGLDKIQDEIQYKQKRTVVSRIPEIDRVGKITAALAFLVPFGTVIVDHTYDDVTIKFGCSPHWIFLLGCILTIAPFIVFIVSIFKKLSFFKKVEPDTTTEISNEEEKTSVDFNLKFKEIQNYLSVNLRITKIVCIIDNLDRIKEEDALKIWSTLQTFVQGKESNIEFFDKTIKFFVLVPYDEQGLRKLWDAKPNETACSTSFFNKSFQLRIYVPQLIVSDWIDFAQRQINEALQDCYTEEEKQDVLNILECTRGSLGDAPTFREIKLYINQIAFLYPLHKKNVNLKSLCYYAVLKYVRLMDYSMILSGLEDGSLPDSSMEIYYDKQTLTKELCSILFMVSQDEGMQLLLQNPIQKALVENPGELSILQNTHGDSFFTVLNYILANEKDLDIHNSVINLHSFINENNNGECEIIKRFVTKESVRQRIFAHVCNYSEEFWRIYVGLAKDNEELKSFINKYFSDNSEDSLHASESAYNYISILYTVISALGTSCSIAIDYREVKYSGVKKIFEVLAENAEVVVNQMINLETFDEDTATEVSNENSDKSRILQMILVQIKLNKIKTWTKSINAIYGNLTKAPITKAVYMSNLEILKELQSSKYNQELGEATKKLFKNQVFWDNLYLVKDERDRFILYNLFYKYTGNISSFGFPQSSNSHNVINDVKNTLQSTSQDVADYFYENSRLTDDYAHYWKLAENQSYRLVGEIIKKAVGSDNKLFFMFDNPYKNLKNAFRLVNSEERPYVTKVFIKHSCLEDELIDADGLEYIDNPDVTYEIIKQTTNINLIKTIIHEIQMTREDEWLHIFNSKTTVLSIPICLKEKQADFTLGEHFYNAFIKSVVDKASDAAYESDKLVLLFTLLDASWKKEFSLQMEKRLQELQFIVSPQIQQFCIKAIKIKYLITERKADFSELIKKYIELKEENILRFMVALINHASMKFVPEGHYSVVLESSVRKLTDSDLKKEIEVIFNIQTKGQ